MNSTGKRSWTRKWLQGLSWRDLQRLHSWAIRPENAGYSRAKMVMEQWAIRKNHGTSPRRA